MRWIQRDPEPNIVSSQPTRPISSLAQQGDEMAEIEELERMLDLLRTKGQNVDGESGATPVSEGGYNILRDPKALSMFRSSLEARGGPRNTNEKQMAAHAENVLKNEQKKQSEVYV